MTKNKVFLKIICGNLWMATFFVDSYCFTNAFKRGILSLCLNTHKRHVKTFYSIPALHSLCIRRMASLWHNFHNKWEAIIDLAGIIVFIVFKNIFICTMRTNIHILEYTFNRSISDITYFFFYPTFAWWKYTCRSHHATSLHFYIMSIEKL